MKTEGKAMKLKLNIEITGSTEADLEDALHEIIRAVTSGFSSGWDANEEGEYDFSISKVE